MSHCPIVWWTHVKKNQINSTSVFRFFSKKICTCTRFFVNDQYWLEPMERLSFECIPMLQWYQCFQILMSWLLQIYLCVGNFSVGTPQRCMHANMAVHTSSQVRPHLVTNNFIPAVFDPLFPDKRIKFNFGPDNWVEFNECIWLLCLTRDNI